MGPISTRSPILSDPSGLGGHSGSDPPDPKPWEADDENPWAVTFDEFLEAWTEAKLPGAGKLQENSTRRNWLQMRLKDDHWRANWREAIQRAGRSTRCRGETPGWPGGMTIDMFLREDRTLHRILEGEFDEKQQASPTVMTREQRRAEMRRLMTAKGTA